MHGQGEDFKASKTYYSKKWRDKDGKRDECRTIDNIYNHDYAVALQRFPSVRTLFKDEDEFNKMKAAHELKNTA